MYCIWLDIPSLNTLRNTSLTWWRKFKGKSGSKGEKEINSAGLTESFSCSKSMTSQKKPEKSEVLKSTLTNNAETTTNSRTTHNFSWSRWKTKSKEKGQRIKGNRPQSSFLFWGKNSSTLINGSKRSLMARRSFLSFPITVEIPMCTTFFWTVKKNKIKIGFHWTESQTWD